MLRQSALVALGALLLLGYQVDADTKKLPQYFKLCERHDPRFDQCVTESVNNLKPYLVKGIRAFRIPPLNPLSLDEVHLNEGNGPVSINLRLKNLKVYGGEQYKVTSVRNELDKYRLQFTLDLPILELLGDYDMNGRALLLPIRGQGRANITVYDMSPNATLIGKPAMRDGLLYMDVEDFPVSIGDARALKLDFDNLFGGNRPLGETMNRFLNDNWRDLVVELRPIIEEVVSAFLISASKGIFHSVPFDSLFPDKVPLSNAASKAIK